MNQKDRDILNKLHLQREFDSRSLYRIHDRLDKMDLRLDDTVGQVMLVQNDMSWIKRVGAVSVTIIAGVFFALWQGIKNMN